MVKRTVYGPVDSWRFGRSAGIDANCGSYCSFDCIYCQLRPVRNMTVKRRKFVEAGRVGRDLREVMGDGGFDMINVSGTGEPTLASNLMEIILKAKEFAEGFGKEVGVLTNSSLISDPKVRKDLSEADVVSLKLDAPDPKLFRRINLPHPDVDFNRMVEGMRRFREEYGGKLYLQMMFLEQNRDRAEEMRELAETINPDLVHLNTPTRLHGEGLILPREEMERIKQAFGGMESRMVYDAEKTGVRPVDREETRERRPESI